MPVLNPSRRPAALSSTLARQHLHWTLWLLAGLVLVTLASCSSLPSIGGGGGEDPDKVLAGIAPDKLAEARALVRDGKPAKAAEVYQELAKSAAPPARAQLELAAADALLKAGDASAATGVLGAINRGTLTAPQQQQLLLTEANTALARGRAGEAAAKLQKVNSRALSASGRVDYYGTLAAAERQAGNILAAAEALDARDRLLSADPAARMDNQVSLLFTLATLGPAGLEKAQRETRGRMRGWVELAEVMSGFGTAGPPADAAFRKWQSGRIGNPAMAGLPRAYFATLAGGYPANAKAMVLLPKGGTFGAPAQAIRDGIQAAYNADAGANRPQLDFRDTAGAIGPRYDGGVASGATLAIGPLQREDVAALAKRPSLPVPTLALNRGGTGSTPNLVQFALAPEDEAVNAANYAWAAGLRNAAILFPSGPWGERMVDAFRVQWRTLGGRFATQQTYTTGLKDYDGSAGKLLASNKADVVFLVAAGPDAQPLWAALQGAGVGVPVVATSHVYDGDVNPDRDAALTGLYFVEIPWLLDAERTDTLSRRALRDRLPNVNGPLARLYAMGIDAYRLAPRIADAVQSAGTFFPGSTGGLTVNALGQVRRQLSLARFTSSGPKVQQAIAAATPAGRDTKAGAESDDGSDADAAKPAGKASTKAPATDQPTKG